MKLFGWLAGAAILIIVIVISVFILNFYSAPISSDPSQWNNFGGYLGGTVGPFLSFLGLIAVLYTIHLQASTLKHMQTTFLEQQEYLIRKEKKEEWLSVIRHAEEQIRNLLATPVMKNGRAIGDVSNLINSTYGHMEQSKRLRESAYAEELIRESVDNFTLKNLAPLCSILCDFADYLTRYKALLAEQEKHQLILHYLSSYLGWYSRLDWIGIMPKPGMSAFCTLLDGGNGLEVVPEATGSGLKE